MVYTWNLKGCLYPDLLVYVCTVAVPESLIATDHWAKAWTLDLEARAVRLRSMLRNENGFNATWEPIHPESPTTAILRTYLQLWPSSKTTFMRDFGTNFCKGTFGRFGKSTISLCS